MPKAEYHICQSFFLYQRTPLKQVSSGIDPNSVVCKEGFELVHKSTDNSPACVKPSTAEKLIQRGWARE